MLAASCDAETRAVCLTLKLLESFVRTSMADVDARLCWLQRSCSVLAGADDASCVGNGVMGRGQLGSLCDYSGHDSLAKGPEGACRCSCYSETQGEGFWHSKIVSMLERQTQVLLLLGLASARFLFLALTSCLS